MDHDEYQFVEENLSQLNRKDSEPIRKMISHHPEGTSY